MATITPTGGSAITFDMIRCTFPRAAERTALSESPGVDGVEVQKLGQGGDRFQATCVHHGTIAAIRTILASTKDTQGQIVVIVDDWGTTFSNLLIEHVGMGSPTPFRVPETTTDARGVATIAGLMLEN